MEKSEKKLVIKDFSNILAIEFDTFDNSEGSHNQVSIQTNGRKEVTRYNDHSIAINHKIPELQNTIRKVKITYDFKDMKVYIDDKLYINKSVHLENIIKLDKGKAWIGFTGATAGAYSQHEILNLKWEKDTKILVQINNDSIDNIGKTCMNNQAILREQDTF